MPSLPRRTRSLVLSVIGALALGACATASTASAGATAPGTAAAAGSAKVHVLGTAYEFNKVEKVLAGGVVKVAEFPKLEAKVAADGRYDLAVPDHSKVTLYAVAPGYHPVYTQTFTTNGVDLDDVNLQTPTDGVYDALVSLLKVPVDANDDPVQCAIVSTFSTKNVRGVDYQAFIGYGPHGVPGATATTTPALPAPMYFNEHVVPDPAQPLSSKDGGVVWTRVPAGVYHVTGKSPTTKFAGFDATCVPGRVVNANPPWGLHELASGNPVKAAATWSRSGKRVTLKSLAFSRLPKQSTIVVGCSLKGCPLSVIKPTASSPTVRPRVAGRPIVLRPGQSLEVWVRSPALNGTVFRWAVPSAGTPKRSALCLPLGDRRPVARC